MTLCKIVNYLKQSITTTLNILKSFMCVRSNILNYLNNHYLFIGQNVYYKWYDLNDIKEVFSSTYGNLCQDHFFGFLVAYPNTCSCFIEEYIQEYNREFIDCKTLES